MSIADWRRKIDIIDSKVLALLSARAQMARKIGATKLGAGRRAFVPTREKEILARLRAENKGPLTDIDLRAIFHEIVSACRALEEPIRVAYVGPEAAATHAAAYDAFGHAAVYLPERDIQSVFSAVEAGRVPCGVVPIENSTEGTVRETIDSFLASELTIMSEEILPIHLTLLGSGKLSDIRKVCSHQLTFSQCRAWLEARLPKAELVETSSIAASAAEAKSKKSVAVIAHEMAARIYGLNVIQRRVEDDSHNATRFVVVGRTPSARTGRDKTSLLCKVEHRPGRLWKLLDIFKRNNLNITYLYPRPAQDEPWQCFFFIDLTGHRDDARMRSCLQGVAKYCEFFKVVGSYPKAD